jgi:hypothetical protein
VSIQQAEILTPQGQVWAFTQRWTSEEKKVPKKGTGLHLHPNLLILRGRASNSWPTTWPGNIGHHEGWAPHRTLSCPAGIFGVGARVFTILALANFRRSAQRGAQTPGPAGAWPAGPGESVRVSDPYCIRLDSAVAGTSCPEAVT